MDVGGAHALQNFACTAGQIMLDPYAKIASKVQLPGGVNVPPPKKGLPSADSQANPPALMGCLSGIARAPGFDWGQSSSPNTPLAETLVLEIDIASLSGIRESKHKGEVLGNGQEK